MKNIKLFFYFAMVILSSSLKSQNPNSIIYNTDNSKLPNNEIKAIAIDSKGNKWMALEFPCRLIKFDGTNWSVYTYNAKLIDSLHRLNERTDNRYGYELFKAKNNSSYITCLAIDSKNNKWIGTTEKGFAKFDGINWSFYNMSNSKLPDNCIKIIAIDSKDNKWIVTSVSQPPISWTKLVK